MSIPEPKKLALLEEDGQKLETNKNMIENIAKTLGGIPKVRNKYSFKGTSGYITVTGKPDIANFAKLYPISKSKGTGNGETALFWLFNCQTVQDVNSFRNFNPKRCFVNQGENQAADPDLKLGKDTFIEVKSTGKNFNQKFALGRFGRFTDFINLVTILQSFDNVFGEKKMPNVDPKNIKNINYDDLVDAAEVFCEVRSVVKSNNLGKYKFFNNIKAKFDDFDDICDKHEILKKCKYGGNVKRFRPGGEEIASRLLAFLCLRAVSEKPGYGNYIVQVPKITANQTSDIKIEYFSPIENKFNLDAVKKASDFSISEENITIKFKTVFG